MRQSIDERKIGGLENFTRNVSNDISFDLYKNFADSEETLRKYGEAFSDFYYISCAPFKSIEEWKNVPEIYEILKRSEHMANGYPLEILIGKYSEESMAKAKKITEKKEKNMNECDLQYENRRNICILWDSFDERHEEIIKRLLGELGLHFLIR